MNPSLATPLPFLATKIKSASLGRGKASRSKLGSTKVVEVAESGRTQALRVPSLGFFSKLIGALSLRTG